MAKLLKSLRHQIRTSRYIIHKRWVAKEKSNDVANIPLWFLAKSLQKMSECDLVYFCKGWETARGCIIEHEAARQYGLDVLYEH